MGKTLAKLLCFGSFAGARAHHQGLRWLKPCQFQRTVYWHCEEWAPTWRLKPAQTSVTEFCYKSVNIGTLKP